MARAGTHALRILAMLVAVSPAFAQSQNNLRETIDLSGTWRFSLDRDDAGEQQSWWTRSFDKSIELPGTLQEQGYGDVPSTETQWMSGLHDPYWYLRDEFDEHTTPGNVKVPFWLNPPRVYTGVAWYQRDVTIPESWRGRRVAVFLERVHWGGKVWLDGERIGELDTLGAPQVYDIGIVEPGEHTLTIRIDNNLLVNVRPDSHSVTDSTQTNWNGIIGRMELFSTTPVYIADAQVYPNIDDKSVRIDVTVRNSNNRAGRGTLSAGGVSSPVQWNADADSEVSLKVDLPDETPLWDEFNPEVLRLTLTLEGNDAEDARELTFGLRTVEARDARFYLNDELVFFRGANEGCQFPLTGYPPTDVESWKVVFRKSKNYGVNHIRFHSFCPPEAAFAAADEMGMYLQPEGSNWGQYQDPKMAPFLERETRAIIDAFGNHPSFLLMSSGNEGGGPYQAPVREWVARWAERDARRLFTGTTGRPVIRAIDTDQINSYAIAIFVGSRAGGGIIRGTAGWHGSDFSQAIAKAVIPVISHESGQWCAYPSFDNFDKYTGFLKPLNYEVFRESLMEAGMLNQAQDFTMASGELQVLSYKEEIEEMLRTKGLGGFQLLDLHDFTGQGTAVVGVLDAFWDSKGYITPEQWRRFCSAVVPLARPSQLTYRASETFQAPVEIANFGPGPIEGARPVWRIVGAGGETVSSGVLEAVDIPRGNGIKLGTVTTALADLTAPAHYRLVVALDGLDDIENDWSFWVYPDQVAGNPPAGVHVVDSWRNARSALADGGRVLLLVNDKELGWTSPPIGRTPVFWNVIMNPKWNRSLGMLIRDDHPALAEFPTDSHSNWQWNDVLAGGMRGLNIDSMPADLRPIVQPIDEWTRNWRLASLMEVRVGEGRLMICTADLNRNLDQRLAARQLRHSILTYMAGDKFNPEVSISPEALAGLFFDTQMMANLGATGDGIDAVIDSDPNTAWTAGFAQRGGPNQRPVQPSDYPHDLTIALAQPVDMAGLRVMDRQNKRAREGDIRDYVLQVSDDGERWRTIKEGRLKSSWKPQTIEFEAPVTARHLRLRALNGYGPSNGAALAELAIIPGKVK